MPSTPIFPPTRNPVSRPATISLRIIFEFRIHPLDDPKRNRWIKVHRSRSQRTSPPDISTCIARKCIPRVEGETILHSSPTSSGCGRDPDPDLPARGRSSNPTHPRGELRNPRIDILDGLHSEMEPIYIRAKPIFRPRERAKLTYGVIVVSK